MAYIVASRSRGGSLLSQARISGVLGSCIGTKWAGTREVAISLFHGLRGAHLGYRRLALLVDRSSVRLFVATREARPPIAESPRIVPLYAARVADVRVGNFGRSDFAGAAA